MRLVAPLLAGVGLLACDAAAQPHPTTLMKVAERTAAPDFSTTDVFGKPVRLSGLRGQRVLLSFMRNAGCAVCNLRVHELRQKADSLRAANTAVVLVYESDTATMREYLADEQIPFTFIADPEQTLFGQYAVETSVGKFLRSMANGVMAKGKAGSALTHKPMPRQDGNMTRIGADFLLDENGIVERAHYGRFVGDHLPL